MSIRQPRKFAIKIVTQDQAASAEHWRIPNDDTETKEPPAKRRRIISVHPTLWDAHGNDMVTVQMGDVRFRLHSSWLAKHSSFFRSLLDGKDVGAQARIERKSEGGDIYHVSAASAADFGILLSAMDNAMYVRLPPPHDCIECAATSIITRHLSQQLLQFSMPLHPSASLTFARGLLDTSRGCGRRTCKILLSLDCRTLRRLLHLHIGTIYQTFHNGHITRYYGPRA